MELILAPFEQPMREEIRTCLIQYDRLGLEAMGLEASDFRRLVNLLDCRGTPETILDQLAESFGSQPVLNDLKRLFLHLSPLAEQQSTARQLEPPFHHHSVTRAPLRQLFPEPALRLVPPRRGRRCRGSIRRDRSGDGTVSSSGGDAAYSAPSSDAGSDAGMDVRT